jgi:hypothetical protein
MEAIKFLSEKKIKLGGVLYKPYTLGSLPPLFAFIYDANEDRDGITNWFNYKGLTYITE